MLIGQIEQEILEDRWFYWFYVQTQSELSDDWQIDLQRDEADVVRQLQQLECNQSELNQTKSKQLE